MPGIFTLACKKQSVLFLFALLVFSFSFAQNTIFQPADVPATAVQNDGLGGIEVGLRFRTTQTGTITGIRFYKGAGTTGTHTGHLWSNTGTMLAEAVFTAETASGWQQVSLP